MRGRVRVRGGRGGRSAEDGDGTASLSIDVPAGLDGEYAIVYQGEILALVQVTG
ncbi:MAG: hypothetical protein QM713_03115 [Arachnia sp.]